MKKRYVILLLVTQTLLFGAEWIYFAWRIEHVEHIKSYVRFFQSAVQVYALDSVIAKREPMFPATLADLQKERYLDSSDIYKIQKLIPDFQYKPPQKSEAPFDIVFTGQFFDYQMECPLFGNVHYTKKQSERAGAANPCAFGTSGISPAGQARMPEASRDT